MKYSLHFPLIILPEQEEQQNQTRAELLKNSHQNYLQEQTKAYQLFLQTQNQISQNIFSLIDNNQTLPGPKFSRDDLELLASGKISTVFGDWFKTLDQYEKLIRMPEPPLLLADRVTGIDAIPASMTKGTMWTETDVTNDSWYLHHNHMPAGIMIESGQADLLLISWLGLDFHNKGERTYRLLGCELTYFGDLPKPGDTLCFDIHVDGHAKHENVRLFFFHYDCHVNGKLLIRVRHGQAGFFTEEELANSGGVLWDAETAEYDVDAQLEKPKINCEYQKFNRQQIEAFAQGDAFKCFGKGFEITQTHTRTPHISSEKLLFLDEITDFDVHGGPWKKGYMRAIQNVHQDDWFFKGHFKNDPCMPGTLMLEAGLQLMSCYLTGIGYTLDKDGWRFEPVPDMTCKLQCRGQVIPTSKQVVYEIFIWSVIAEPIPMIFADLLGTVDGLKAFHTKIGLRLIPDWPLELSLRGAQQRGNLEHFQNATSENVAHVNDSYDYSSLLACAYGKPSDALGEMYKPFDTYKRVPRLPAPPYHFISRIIDVTAKANSMSTEGEVIVEYDLEENAWYFNDNNQKTLPFCVLMEIGLQPCGWLASYLGSALRCNYELKFRNLDGKAKIYNVITPEMKTLTTKVKCTNISQSSGMILESFKVEIFNQNDIIYEMQTVFGFFQDDAFVNQSGLTVPENEKNILTTKSDFLIDFNKPPEKLLNKMPKNMLLMLDRVTGYWQENNIIQLRAEKDVKYSDWFFKAHFFQDPVQPGSLGLDAMMQLMQFYLIEKNNFTNPKFHFDNSHSEIVWKYRGQVLPSNKLVSILITIDSEDISDDSITISATGSLYVDGKRIYEAKNLVLELGDLYSNDDLQQ